MQSVALFLPRHDDVQTVHRILRQVQLLLGRESLAVDEDTDDKEYQQRDHQHSNRLQTNLNNEQHYTVMS